MRYMNATALFPKDVLLKASEKLSGHAAWVYFPSVERLNRDRVHREVVRLHRLGVRVPAIAEDLFISERTVWRILARWRAGGAPSARPQGRTPQDPQPRTPR